MSTAVVTTNVASRPPSTAPILRSRGCRVRGVARAESRALMVVIVISFRRYDGADRAGSTSDNPSRGFGTLRACRENAASSDVSSRKRNDVKIERRPDHEIHADDERPPRNRRLEHHELGA